jgi:hypothetical protein
MRHYLFYGVGALGMQQLTIEQIAVFTDQLGKSINEWKHINLPTGLVEAKQYVRAGRLWINIRKPVALVIDGRRTGDIIYHFFTLNTVTREIKET